MRNNNGRGRDGSGPGSVGSDGVEGLAERLVKVARDAVAGLARPGSIGDSPGEALRATDQPRGAAGPVLVVSADANREPVRVLRFIGPDLGRVRAENVARLSAAADDAAELAEGFGLDVRLAIVKGYGSRVFRLARIAFRCAEECRRLRALADAVQDVSDGPLCEVCGAEEPLDVAGRLCLRCAMKGDR